MKDYGKATSRDTVQIERLLPGPIERVWDYLTDSEKRGKWLASGEMELRVGGKVQLHFLHSSLTPHLEPTPERFKNMECGVGFEGVVTHCEPPRLLAYTWGGDTSEVKFELAPQGDKVLLVITHTRLRDRDEQTLVATGWHTHLGILEDNLGGETPRPFWSTFGRVENDYKRLFAEQAAAVSDDKTVSVQVTHRFAHSPEKVFDAWLNPAIASKFLFATEAGTIIRCDIDARVGGKFVIVDRREMGDVEHTGEYLEIDRPRQLRFTFGVPQFSSDFCVVTINIEPVENGCELTLTAERLLAEWAERTREGWGKILHGLQGTLASRKQSICLSRLINHPPAKVWRALTDPAIHARWWAAGDVKAEVGHRFTLDMGPWGQQPCEVLAVEPERLLQYSFALDTTITWRLEPEGGGTRLFLEHSGFDMDFPMAKKAFEGMSRGWPGVLDRMAPAIEADGSSDQRD